MDRIDGTPIDAEILPITTISLGFDYGIEIVSTSHTTIQSNTVFVESNTQLLYGFTTRCMDGGTIV